MSRKRLTWLLLAVVLIVWGAVLYRFLHGRMAPGNVPIASMDTSTSKVAPVDTTVDRTLALNYRDPFLDKAAPKAEAPVSRPVASTKTSMAEQALTWPDIRYKGMLRSAGGKALVGLISLDGKEILVHEGDEIGTVKVQRILPDSMVAMMPAGGRRTFRVRP